MQIYGLIGYPVKHSLSPLMHNAAFRALKINAEYRLFEVSPERLTDLLLNNISFPDIEGKLISATDLAGFNITIPHKIKAREILEKKFPFKQEDYLTQEDLYYVKLSGAINTVKRNGSKLEYRNTDAAGFLESLDRVLGFEAKDKKVMVIGCGGAGRAIVAALSWKNVGIKKIFVNDIKKEAMDSARAHFLQFEHLKDRLEFIATEEIPQFIKESSLLVNASSVGMKGEDVSVLDKSLFYKGLYVYDIAYNRNSETRLIQDAKVFGLKTAEGIDMLLYQGVRAFEFWTGTKAPIEIMRRALKEGV
jgi:shikimate dehydrogenase